MLSDFSFLWKECFFGENVMEWVIVSFMYDNYWELLFFFRQKVHGQNNNKNKYQNIHKLTMTMKKNCTPAFSLYFPLYFIGVVNKYIHALSISFSFSLLLLLLSLSLSLFIYIIHYIYLARCVCVCWCILASKRRGAGKLNRG